MYGVKFSDKRAYLELSPCLQHKIRVTLLTVNVGGVPFCQSKFTIYNELKYEAKYSWYKILYAGLLNKEVVQKTCLQKTNMTGTIPEVPPGLTKCIGEKEIRSSIILGQSLRVRFVIVNPENEDQFIDVDADVDKLDFCLDENSTEKKQGKYNRKKQGKYNRKKQSKYNRIKQGKYDRKRKRKYNRSK